MTATVLGKREFSHYAYIAYKLAGKQTEHWKNGNHYGCSNTKHIGSQTTSTMGPQKHLGVYCIFLQHWDKTINPNKTRCKIF